MSTWQICKWEDVLTIKNGKNQKNVINPEGMYPIYGSGGVMGYADDYLCPEGTTVIGRKGSINNPIYVESKFWNVDTAFGLIPKSDLHNKYFYYFCKTYNFLKHNKATTLPSLTKTDLLKISIPLPPLEEQKKIAAILDAADYNRQKTKSLIEKYDQLTQSLFLGMFGDPVTNSMGWEKVTLGSCLTKVQKIGKNFSEETIQYVDIASVDNVTNTIKQTTEFRTKERPSRAQQILLSKDIIYSTVRPNLKNIAINHEDGRIASTGFFVCRTLKDLLTSSFLFHVLLSDSATDYFVGITSGANYPAVKSTDMRKFLIIKPPIELQNQFTERVAQIEKQKQQAEASLVKAEELFSSLLQRAFKGELTS